MDIKISYDGKYPNLCSGHLIVTIDDIKWDFGNYCLSSGGSTYFTDNYSEEHVTHGDWSIHTWPDNFPDDLKEDTLKVINDNIRQGCCGGCL